MYHFALASLFVALSAHTPHRKVWATLAAVSIAEGLARVFYTHNDFELYVIRSTAALLGGLFLARLPQRLAWWQAGVYFLTLFAYFGLAVDVGLRTYSVFYDNFGAITYGLVFCQLIGCAPTVLAAVVHTGSSSAIRLGHLQKDKKA